MKKLELIFVGIFFLIASYFVFRYVTKKKDFNTWNLVTSNSAIVYESNTLISTWNRLIKSTLWQTLSKIEEVNQMNETLQLIDSLSGKNGQLASFFNTHSAIISAHVTSQKSYGLIYYFSLGKSGYNLFLNLLVNLKKQKKTKRTQRVYRAETIYELALNKTKISYFIYKNNLIISKEAFLIEDVVRNIKNKFNDNFIKRYASLKANPSFVTDDGNLYVNGNEILPLGNSFLDTKNRIDNAAFLAKEMFFDVTLTDNELLASGFAYDTDNNSITSTFKDQQAAKFKLKALIPKNTAIVEHFASNNLNKWYLNWLSFHKKEKLNRNQGIKFVKFLKNELAQITLQSPDKEHLNKLFIAEIANVDGMHHYLNKIAEQQVEKKDSLYIENYAGKKIQLIDNESILKKYFGFDGFQSTYYLFFDKYIIIANSAKILRHWLIQMENELVWSKSTQMNLFLKNALKEANYTYVTNLEYSWNLQLNKLNKPLKKWVNTNSSTLKKINTIAFQISNLDNRYYTNFYVNYFPIFKKNAEQKILDVSTIQFTNRIIKKPRVFINKKTGEREFLAQDSLTNLTLTEANGKILWTDSLGVKLEGKIYPIDFFKNNKVQYLFHSDSTLFLVDKNGNNVASYPIKLEYAINKLYLIDYDQTKKYRILISDHFGNLRMYDKKGNNLEGWAPNQFGSNFSEDIFHLRVRGKDRILIPLAKGNVHLNNRRGNPADGFPLDLEINISNKFFVQIGENFNKTKFVTISEDGLVISFLMTGKILSRNQLLKSSNQSTFQLIKEKTGKDYVFVRNDLNRVAILSPKGEMFFEKNFPETPKKQVQYYNFGFDKKLFVIKAGKQIYLYTESGKLLNSTPLISEFSISIIYSSNKKTCYLYLTNENKIETKKFYF